jgi:hypothetical protein
VGVGLVFAIFSFILLKKLVGYINDVMEDIGNNKTIYDLPRIKYDEFIKFYNVKSSVWKLGNGYVLKLNMESSLKDNYIYYGNSRRNEEIREFGFRFSFIDYLKYSKYKTEIEKERVKKKNIESYKKKEKEDLDKMSKLIDSIKKDLDEM